MFEHLKFKYQLAKELRVHEKIDAAFDEEIKAAKAAKKPSTDIHEIEHRRRWELELSNDEIRILSSRYWQARAYRYQIGMPNEAKDWISSCSVPSLSSSSLISTGFP